MIFAVFKHQWLRQWRSRTLRLLLPLNLLLIVAVASVHWYQQQAFFDTQQHWQQVNQQLWDSQPDRHPHRVSHYGSLSFRFNSALSFLDAGVNPYVGNVLFLEAHRQNSSGLRQFSVSARELGLGYLSVATLLLTLWPLVLIALAHDAVSGERSNGNLNLLRSLGLRPWQLMLGQGLVFALISALYLAAIGFIAAFFIVLSPSQEGSDNWLRLGLCLLVYLSYCLIWISAILVISNSVRSSTQSLLLALCLWLLWVIIVPKTLTTLAQQQYPTPSRTLFDVSLQQAAAKIGDSHNPEDPYFNQFRERLLKKHQVERIEDLPVNWRGVVMQEGERILKQVFDQHYQQLLNKYQQQDALHTWFSVASPFALASRYSMHITGSSAEDYYAFEQQAEEFRFHLISRLNELQAKQIAYIDDKKTRLSHQHWRTFEPFRFQQPALSFKTSLQAATLVTLLFWLTLAVLAYRLALKRN